MRPVKYSKIKYLSLGLWFITTLILPQNANTETFKVVTPGRIADAEDSNGVSLVHFFKPAGGILPTLTGIYRKPAQLEGFPQLKGNELFPIDPRIQKKVKFWVNVYSKWTTEEGVIHDSKYVDIIYGQIDFRDLNDFTIPNAVRKKKIEERIKSEKERYKNVLLSIEKKQTHHSTFTPEEQRIYELFIGIDEQNKFRVAADKKRLRFQLGQKDRFMQGLHYSGKYLPVMEKIFKEKGLPMELTRLPFVESSFNLRARSKVGASGVWQFMRSTGKLFLKIDDVIDERNDPIRATEASSELLRGNYETLGAWPLALTAYNHGRLGMVRAVQKVGSSNLADIIDHYKSPSFGFASSNFYAEFIAAVEVSVNAEHYFGKIEVDKPIDFAEFVMTDFVDFKDLSTYTRIPLDVLQELNPGLTDTVVLGALYVPAGFVLRIPPSHRDLFLSRYGEIPSHRRFSSQKALEKGYVARVPASTESRPKKRPRQGSKRR